MPFIFVFINIFSLIKLFIVPRGQYYARQERSILQMPSYQCQDPGRLAQLRPVAVVIHPVTQRHMEPQVAEVSILHTSGLGSDRYCNLVVKVSTHSHGTRHKDSGLWYHILQARRTTGSTSLRSQMMQSQLHSLHFG